MSNKEETNPNSLNIENLYSSVISDLSPLSSNCCIYKVPNRLRIINKNAYTPQVVSIGPHHHGNEALRAMEQHKWRYLHHFIETYKMPIQFFIHVVKLHEDGIRACFAEQIMYARDHLIAIVMLDAVFIIGILLRFYSKEFENENDRIYYKPWMIQHIVPDLQLLENQIPFFIIEEIYEEIKSYGSLPTCAPELSMKEVAYKFFKYYVGFIEDNQVRKIEFDKILHFVDLGRKLCIPDESRIYIYVGLESANPIRRLIGGEDRAVSVRRFSITEKDRRTRQSLEKLKVPTITKLHCSGVKAASVRRFCITEGEDHGRRHSLEELKVPTITKLHCSGVKFEVGPRNEMFKINFKNGILSISKLFINDTTELFVRNIIAFEQCNSFKCTISNYFAIIKRLVYTHQDLKLLFKYGIVDHSLGDSKDVFSLITKLADEITVDYTDTEFVSLCKEMDDYCKKPHHKWMANLKQIYFDTPWTTISVIAASIMFILTFIQAICAILSLKSTIH